MTQSRADLFCLDVTRQSNRGRSAACVWALAILCALLAGCSREAVNAAPSETPAATVESTPDRNVITVAKPERFAVAPAVRGTNPTSFSANGVVVADVSRSYAVNALSRVASWMSKRAWATMCKRGSFC